MTPRPGPPGAGRRATPGLTPIRPSPIAERTVGGISSCAGAAVAGSGPAAEPRRASRNRSTVRAAWISRRPKRRFLATHTTPDPTRMARIPPGRCWSGRQNSGRGRTRYARRRRTRPRRSTVQVDSVCSSWGRRVSHSSPRRCRSTRASSIAAISRAMRRSNAPEAELRPIVITASSAEIARAGRGRLRFRSRRATRTRHVTGSPRNTRGGSNAASARVQASS